MTDRPITSSLIDRAAKAELAATRDAKIVRLWNEGLSSATLAARFGVTRDYISGVIKVARDRGETVRLSPYNTGRRTA